MPYTNARNRTTRGEDLTTKASGAETASTSGTGFEVSERGTVRLTLTVIAVAGTAPALDVTVETSSDNGVADAWRSIGTFPQQTAAGSVRRSFGGCDRWVRTRSVVGGSAGQSLTYTVTGEAV